MYKDKENIEITINMLNKKIGKSDVPNLKGVLRKVWG